jgi:YidC/Oxa1 family membrane protein insertase
MLLASNPIGQIFHPFYLLFAWLISAFYDFIPNYAVAIALLTLTVMIVVFPITLKGTRGMIKMQLLAPELKVIQNRYKAKPGMSVEERQESRQKLNEEMMALYKENNANPAGGCVPMFLQLPVFVVLYGTIKGLVHTTTVKGVVTATPLYISKTSKIYHDIRAGHGQLRAFGIDLADSVKSAGSWGHKAPFVVLILVAIALHHTKRKEGSGGTPLPPPPNPQMQTMQRVMPIVFAVIYISIPAGVNIYFIISSLFRIGQQDAMYRWDPSLQASLEKLKSKGPPTPVPQIGGGGILARFREATAGGVAPTNGAAGSNGARSTNGAKEPAGPANTTNTKNGRGAAFTPPRTQTPNRSKTKKPRRSR